MVGKGEQPAWFLSRSSRRHFPYCRCPKSINILSKIYKYPLASDRPTMPPCPCVFDSSLPLYVFAQGSSTVRSPSFRGW
jgi:hypothetical protein